uniref:Uncharacterized protein n=1 Tax=Anopheles minimus TaxID=112268 RepID=A0A182WNN2_9DIPT
MNAGEARSPMGKSYGVSETHMQ